MKHYLIRRAILLATALIGLWPPALVPGSPVRSGVAFAEPSPSAAPSEGDPTNAGNAYLPTPDEVKLGREGAAEAEKQYKIIKEGEQVRRLQAIGEEVLRAASDPAVIREFLAENHLPRPKDHSRRVAFTFSFKLADSKEVNAFSFAAGPVYVTTGLMDYVQSDHELAAVLAHEITHVMHHHLAQLIQRQSKAEQKLMWALLAGLLAGATNSPDFPNVLLGAQLYMIAKQYGYGRDAERDADKTGVQYLRRTRFSPIGMLTVMKRFARDEARRGGPDLGIFQSHPYARERTELITGYLREAGIKVDSGTEREVSNAFRTETRSATAAGRPVAEIVLNGDVLFRATAAEGQAPLDRARAIAKRLTEMLDQNLTMRSVRLSEDKSQIVANGRALLTVYPSDAEASGASVAATTQRALDVLLKALWKEQLDLTF